MKKILISACLCGEAVKYNGGDNRVESKILKEWGLEDRLVTFCPEVAGGLSVPRSPCERRDGSVFNKDYEDVTEQFFAGAEKALEIINGSNEDEPVVMAVLKEGSPSCGVNEIYDGTFTGRRISGMGVTAQLLKEHDIPVFSETQLEEAYDYLEQFEADDELHELMSQMFF